MNSYFGLFSNPIRSELHSTFVQIFSSLGLSFIVFHFCASAKKRNCTNGLRIDVFSVKSASVNDI